MRSNVFYFDLSSIHVEPLVDLVLSVVVVASLPRERHSQQNPSAAELSSISRT